MTTPDPGGDQSAETAAGRGAPCSGLAALVDERDLTDPYRWLRDETNDHRRRHRCCAYPYADGTVLGVLVSVLRPRNVLELETALGYTACWWASQGADVHVAESDPAHRVLAREHIERAAPLGRVSVHDEDAALSLSVTRYDVVFLDAYEPPQDVLRTVCSRVAPNGCLVATNLELDAGRARRALQLDDTWKASIVADLALCTRGKG